MNYLIVTRPDISFAVSGVSQFLNSPCEDHWNVVIHIVKYIQGSPGKSLLYSHNNHTKVVCYSDADWAGSPSNRRSTSGYCVSIGDNLISWKSKKQSVVARSSAETKYRVMASAACELIWLKQLLKELQFGEVTQMTLICDNQAALHISSNPVFHEGPNILRMIVISFEKRLYQEISRVSLLIQIINYQIYLLNPYKGLGLITFVTRWVHMIYMHQLEGEC